MPSVPHPYDNTARPAVHASYRARTSERPAPPTAPPTSETAVSQADGAA